MQPPSSERKSCQTRVDCLDTAPGSCAPAAAAAGLKCSTTSQKTDAATRSQHAAFLEIGLQLLLKRYIVNTGQLKTVMGTMLGTSVGGSDFLRQPIRCGRR